MRQCLALGAIGLALLAGVACHEGGGAADAGPADAGASEAAVTCPQTPPAGDPCVAPLRCEYAWSRCENGINGSICDCWQGAFSCSQEDWCQQEDAGTDGGADAVAGD